MGALVGGRQQMFLTPGPLAIPLPLSSASLPSTLPFPHSYHLLSLSLLALFLNPSFLFPLYFLSSLLSLLLSHSSFFLPMAFSFQSFSCPLFCLSALSSPHLLPTAPAYFPLYQDSWSGEEKGKGHRDPLNGEAPALRPWGLVLRPCPPHSQPGGGYSV